MMKGIIDRFEGEYAMVEIEGLVHSIERCDIPDNAREGDLLVFDNNLWIIDRKKY